jgi:DNA-binding response OmpR family regulator
MTMDENTEQRVAVVIEDDDDIRHLLETVLTQAGFRVVATSNGADGVEAVRKNDPVVTTLDVNMPGMDGFETARRIRAFSATYIVMLTALNEEIDTLQGLEAGADDYVNKPFRPRELRARIEAMLRRPRAALPDEQDAATPAPTATPVSQPVEQQFPQQQPYLPPQAPQYQPPQQAPQQPYYVPGSATPPQQPQYQPPQQQPQYTQPQPQQPQQPQYTQPQPPQYQPPQQPPQYQEPAQQPVYEAPQAPQQAPQAPQQAPQVAPQASQFQQAPAAAPYTEPVAPVAAAVAEPAQEASAPHQPTGIGGGWLEHNKLWLNIETRVVKVDDDELDLTRSEFDLLAALLESNRRVRTKADLVLLLRGESYVTSHFISEADKRAIEVHMGNLRKKLGDNIGNPRWIETVRGVGYRLTAAGGVS